MDTGKTFSSDSLNIISLIFRYWKILAITTAAGLIASAIASVFVKPLYRSLTVIYPTTNVTETQSLLGIPGTTTPLFGDESATEKILQIIRSDEIRKYLAEKYNLMDHYGIKENARYRYTLLSARMNKYIKARKTQYNSVEISVLDRLPELAATIANDIALRIDTVFNNLVKEAGHKSYNAIRLSYNEQQAKVRALEDSLKINTEKGSIAFFQRTTNRKNQSELPLFNSGNVSPEAYRLFSLFESENQSLAAIGSRLTETWMLATQTLPYVHIVNKAEVPEKKAFPRRKIIVLASASGAFLIALFAVAFFDKYSKLSK